MKKSNGNRFLKNLSQGTVIFICLLFILFITNSRISLGEALIADTLTGYHADSLLQSLFVLPGGDYDHIADSEQENQLVFADENRSLGVSGDINGTNEATESNIIVEYDPDNIRTFAVNNKTDVNDNGVEKLDYGETELVGIDELLYQPEAEEYNEAVHIGEPLTIANLAELRNLDYLARNFYIVDPRTGMTAKDFDVDAFLKVDMKIDMSNTLPKILIIHTHAYEGFVDSDPANLNEGVLGLGERLCQILSEKYGITAMQDRNRYDLVNGSVQVLGAYDRMEPYVIKILAENPSIEMVIDIHRDGLKDETVKLLSTVNGKPTAKIMFFNGLSKENKKGIITPLDYLPNPNLGTNLALSFQMQLVANELYPGFTRKIYLNAYRYSLNMLPKSMLVEVGAQTNTKQEALNAMEPLADILANVILGGDTFAR